MRPNRAPTSPPGSAALSRKAAKLASSPRRLLKILAAAWPAALASAACSTQMAAAFSRRYSVSGKPRSRGWRPACDVPLPPYRPTLKASRTAASTSAEMSPACSSGFITSRSMTFRERIASGAMAERAKASCVERPMPLQALRRDSRAHRAAEGHPLGQAAVIPVQQGRRVRMQGVDLQKP